jgi:colanic acid/amylovoran biosynthesis glycosyltransferase
MLQSTRMLNVIHFVRESGQLKDSFIQNQINNHYDFKPVVIFHDLSDSGGYANGIQNNIDCINIGCNSKRYEKFLYKKFQHLSHRQVLLLRNNIFQIHPDIMHFHYGTDAGIYLKVLKDINIPKVVSFYGYDCSSFPKRFGGLGKYYLRKFVFRYSDKILAMSNDMKNDLILLGCPENKILVHYHGIPTSLFAAKHVYHDDEVIRYLIICRLVPKKGHYFLIKSFAKAYYINPKIRLTIVGSGILEKGIKTLVTSFHMNDVIKMIPSIKYASNEHLSLLASHDVFIHPSITAKSGDKEGIPGAIVEAMAAGLPVISTYHAGIPYVITDNVTGMLSKENDIDSLCTKILIMASDVNIRKRIGEAGQEYAIDNLDMLTKEKELENIYVGQFKY